MMSRWTHAVCDPCFRDRSAADDSLPAEPVRASEPKLETCCACGTETASGIYLRVDPATLQCGGQHREDAA